MALQDIYGLQGVTHYNKDYLNKHIKYGTCEFFRWALLCHGAFQNISANQANVFGGRRDILRMASDPRYTDGQVWEGFKGDWVWETGVPTDYISSQPIRVSGVYVDDTFYSISTTGDYAHTVDYPRGRIIFDSAIPTTSTVRTEFSIRDVSFVESVQPHFQKLLWEADRTDREDFLAPSGNWSALAETRLALPVVGVGVIPRRRMEGWELGGSQAVDQDISFVVLSDNDDDIDKLVDIVTYQHDKTIWLPNKNRMKENADWPLDFEGSPVANAKTYPQLIQSYDDGGYRWRRLFFKRAAVDEINVKNPHFYAAFVRMTGEIIMPDL